MGLDTSSGYSYYRRMTHDSAVRTIKDLAPAIERDGAESVLLKYASEKDLPVAQLEKLAQVYNTARTLMHLQASDSPASSVALVDVPSLALNYAGGLEQACAPAKVKSAAATHTSDVDLLAAVRREVFGAPEPKLTKAAAVRVVEDCSSVTVSPDQLMEHLHDLAAEARVELSKCATTLLRHFSDRHNVNLGDIESDLLTFHDRNRVKSALDWFSGYFPKSAHINRYPEDAAAPQRKMAFLTEAGELASDLVSAYAASSEYKKLSQMSATEIASVIGLKRASTDTEEGIVVEPETDQDKAKPDPRKALEERMKRKGVPAEQADSGEEGIVTPNEQGEAPKNRKQKSTRDESSEVSDTERGQREKAGPKGSGESMSMSPTDRAVDLPPSQTLPGRGLKFVADSLASGARSVGDAATGLASATDRVLARITDRERSNAPQRRADESVADLRRRMELARHFAKDPVLREADPRLIESVYNSIARVNPELAYNIPAVSLILREGTNYDGITLDAQKQLVDIRKGIADAESKENDNSRRRYSIGGSELPAVLRATTKTIA